MSRTPGSRNADFADVRDGLLRNILHVVSQAPLKTSFSELTAASGVSRATIRHYFSTREELLEALLDHMSILGEEAAARFPEEDGLPLEQSLRDELDRFALAWRVGVGALFTAGLLWGLGHERLGPAYVRSLLEPTLQRTEAQLARRLSQHGMDAQTARHAALALVSPVLVALLHQEALFGNTCRPLDLTVFLAAHLESFLKGWVGAGRVAG